MLNITYYNRDKRNGNFSIEELFTGIRAGLTEKIHMSDFEFNPALGRFKSIFKAKKFQGDVNHITGDVNFLAYGLQGSKTIITIHDIGHYEKTLKGWKKIIYKYLWLVWPMKKVKIVTTISEFTKTQIIKYFNISAEKIFVVHNPCPVNFTYKPRPFNKVKPNILQIGSGHNKNIFRLIEALKGIPCVLTLIRKPDARIEDLLMEHSIAYKWLSNLTYDEVAQQYEECDIVFFASEYEGFGIPILEANATGRAVITGNVTAMPEIAGNAACIVDPFDVNAIRDGITKLIENDIYRNQLIANGIENIKRFELGYIAGQYLDLYKKIAKP